MSGVQAQPTLAEQTRQQPSAPAPGSPGGSPRHWVLPPPAGDGTAPEEPVAVPETSLIDILLCDHRHCLTLFNHFTMASAQGNTHAMELLSGALALDIRLHTQAVLDVLCPLLERRYGGKGAELAGRVRQQLQAVERHVLEMLTFRREQDWPALAQRVNLTHQDFAAHIHDMETGILPRLVAAMKQDELVSAGLLFQQQKQTAPLAPQTGAAAFAAAAAVGPEAASVLGGPVVAGQYQQHAHAWHSVQGSMPGGAASLPIAMPDKIVTPSQQLLEEEQ